MRSNTSKLDHLEGLRGIAAMVVVIAHLKQTFWCDFELDLARHFRHIDGLPRAAYQFVRNIVFSTFDGNFSVWLFWVMSAYVLSIHFYKTSGEAAFAKLSDATLRRYPRLALPVLVSVLFAWALHAGHLMTNTKLAEQLGPVYGRDVASFYVFEADFTKAINSALWQTFFAYDPGASYNRVLWTMEVELYGSFFLFATMALLGKHRARHLMVGIIAVVLYKLGAIWLISFLAGMVLCDLMVNEQSKHHRERLVQVTNWLKPVWTAGGSSWWGSGILFVATLALIGCPNYFGSFHLLLATVVTLIALLSPIAQRALRARPFVFLGKISFGLYLAHLPILCAAAHPIYSNLVRYVDSPAAAVITSIVIVWLSVLGGWLLWFIADRHAVTLSRVIAAKLESIAFEPQPEGSQPATIALETRSSIRRAA